MASQKCLQDREMGGESKRNLSGVDWRWSIRSANVFHRGRKNKQTQIKMPWRLVGRGCDPKYASDGRCRRKERRLGAGELGLERKSVAVPSRKVEGPVVVRVRSVGGELKAGSDGRRRLSRR